MRYTAVLFSLASVTLLACATGATLDGAGGSGSGGMPGVTNGSTTSKTSANSTVANGSTNSATVTSADSSANSTVAGSTVAGSTVAGSTVASTSVASTTVASSSSMSSTGSGVVVCDPENPGPGCGAAQHCVPQANNMPTCEPAGAGTQYVLCATRSECATIYECVNDGLDACCMRWCNSDLDCGFSETCVDLAVPPSANGQTYGVCWDGYPCVI